VTLQVGQRAYRCILEDVARITKISATGAWVMFEDFRIFRANYVWPLERCGTPAPTEE
jgi:hypothetical protein